MVAENPPRRNTSIARTIYSFPSLPAHQRDPHSLLSLFLSSTSMSWLERDNGAAGFFYSQLNADTSAALQGVEEDGTSWLMAVPGPCWSSESLPEAPMAFPEASLASSVSESNSIAIADLLPFHMNFSRAREQRPW